MAARGKRFGGDDPAVPNWDDIAREFRLAYSEWYSYAAVEIRFASTGLGEPRDVIGTRYAPQTVYMFRGFGHTKAANGIDVVRYVMLLAPPNAMLGGGECSKVLDLVCGAGRLLRSTRNSDGEADAIRWFDRLLKGPHGEGFTSTARSNADKPIRVGVKVVRDLVRASASTIAEIQRRTRPTRGIRSPSGSRRLASRLPECE